MKKLAFFFSLILLIASSSFAYGQLNGNTVISAVQLYDNGGGTCFVEVQLSGNMTNSTSVGSFIVSGPRINGGTSLGILNPSNEQILLQGNGPVTFVGSFPLMPSLENGQDFLEVEISIQGVIWSRKVKANGNKRYVP